MSAYVVSDSHITAIACYAFRNRKKITLANGKTALEIAALLYAANVKSVNYRYNENTGAGDFMLCEKVAFKSFTAMQIFKAVHCLDYQSCEPSDWETSAACHLLRQIEARLVQDNKWFNSESAAKTREYDACAWGIDLDSPRASAIAYEKTA